MNHYFANCLPGSVILLDDYGHLGYEDTRREVDNWLLIRSDFIIEVYPTGQALLQKVL